MHSKLHSLLSISTLIITANFCSANDIENGYNSAYFEPVATTGSIATDLPGGEAVLLNGDIIEELSDPSIRKDGSIAYGANLQKLEKSSESGYYNSIWINYSSDGSQLIYQNDMWTPQPNDHLIDYFHSPTFLTNGQLAFRMDTKTASWDPSDKNFCITTTSSQSSSFETYTVKRSYLWTARIPLDSSYTSYKHTPFEYFDDPVSDSQGALYFYATLGNDDVGRSGAFTSDAITGAVTEFTPTFSDTVTNLPLKDSSNLVIESINSISPSNNSAIANVEALDDTSNAYNGLVNILPDSSSDWIAYSRNPAPIGSALFDRFGAPSADSNGNILVWASLIDDQSDEGLFHLNQEGVWTSIVANNTSITLIDESEIVLDRIQDPYLLDDGSAIFVANINNDASNSPEVFGVFKYSPSSQLELIARSGDNAPGTHEGVEIDIISSLWVNDNGQLAFVASLTGDSDGISNTTDSIILSTDSNGILLPVIREGDTIELSQSDLRTVESIELGGISDNAELAVIANYTDGASSIIRTSLIDAIAPVIDDEIADIDSHVSQSITLVSSASGYGDIVIQWYKDNEAILGSTGVELILADLELSDSGIYHYTATSKAGVTASEPATITIDPIPDPPVFVSSPQSESLYVGENTVLSSEAISNLGLSYQWYHDGEAIAGATSSTLSLTDISADDEGVYNVRAYNNAGEAYSEEATISVPLAPTVTLSPASTEVEYGDILTLRSNATSNIAVYYEWQKDGVPIIGATSKDLTILGVVASDAGVYRVRAFNHAGIVFSDTATITVTQLPQPPQIISQPKAQAAGSFGETITLSADATSNAGVSYQWYKDGIAIDGATDATLTIAKASVEDEGTYHVVVYNDEGEVLSASSVIDVEDQRLINISTRASVGTGSNVLIAGFAISGDNAKTVLIRGVGPTLGDFGIPTYLDNPKIELRQGDLLIEQNSGWTEAPNSEAIELARSIVGAFEIPEQNDDAAMLVTLQPGAYTATLSGESGETGVGLIEVYEVESGLGRFSNISSRAYVGTGSEVLIPGVVVSGDNANPVLVRAIGPTLSDFGVAGTLERPVMDILDSEGNVIASNSRWGDVSNVSDLRAATTDVGAFELTEGSYDAAMLLDLEPGLYTIRVRGENDTTGVALVELYEIRE